MALVCAAGLAALALVLYGKLLLPSPTAERPILQFFALRLLPFGLLHLLGLFLLRRFLGPQGRYAILYWALSACAILAAGGTGAILAFLSLAVILILLSVIGAFAAGALFEEARRNWALSLGFGLLLASWLAAGLSVFHLFRREIVLALLLVCSILPAGRFIRRLSSRILTWGGGPPQPWPASRALAFEGLFLLAIFAWVGASPPESHSDAMRVYWPYVRLLARFHGFFPIGSQPSFIVPEAGVSYTSVLFLLAGARAARESMPVALAALAGLVAFRGRRASPAGPLVALVLAACPLLLWASLSVMQEAFICLAAFLMALVCLEGAQPDRVLFWIGVGGMIGAAWCARYTAVVYAAPLLVWAAGRSLRAGGVSRTLKGLCAAAGAGLLAAGPWLWNTYRQSGNPFFPFLRRLFPNPLWPYGLRKLDLNNFRFPAGWLAIFTWPYEVTFHSNRFIQGSPGFLGMAVPVLLLLALPAILSRQGRPACKWILCAVAGTAILWTQTAYLRYWLPGLWLLAPAAVAGAEILVRSEKGWRLAGSLSLAVLLLQIPFEMAHTEFPGFWSSLDGWGWDSYTGRFGEEAFLRRYPGYDAFSGLNRLDVRWPCVWYTGVYQLGALDAIPQRAAVWDFAFFHEARDREAIVRFIDAFPCDYWIVNRSTLPANLFRRLGVADLFWNRESLVVSDEAVDIYRMPRR